MPENAHVFAPLVDCFIVGTGISYEGDFHNLDPERLARLLAFTRSQGEILTPACLFEPGFACIRHDVKHQGNERLPWRLYQLTVRRQCRDNGF